MKWHEMIYDTKWHEMIYDMKWHEMTSMSQRSSSILPTFRCGLLEHLSTLLQELQLPVTGKLCCLHRIGKSYWELASSFQTQRDRMKLPASTVTGSHWNTAPATLPTQISISCPWKPFSYHPDKTRTIRLQCSYHAGRVVGPALQLLFSCGMALWQLLNPKGLSKQVKGVKRFLLTREENLDDGWPESVEEQGLLC